MIQPTRNKSLSVVATTILFTFAPIHQASATAIANAKLSNLTISLEDLSTNDPNTPYVIFGTSPNATYAYARSKDPYYWFKDNRSYGTSPFGENSIALSAPVTYGSTSLFGDISSNGGVTIESTSKAFSSAGEYALSHSGLLFSATGEFIPIVVSPNTKLTIGGYGFGSSYAFPNEKPDHKEFAYSNIELALRGDYSTGDRQYSYIQQTTFAGLDSNILYDEDEGFISVDFYNRTDSHINGYFYGYVSSEALSAARLGPGTSVPEPSNMTLSLLFAALMTIKREESRRRKLL